jgi:cytochrome c
MRRLLPAVLATLLLLATSLGHTQLEAGATPAPPQGDPGRGRLVFAPCRTCHFTQAEAGHGNGPNLHRIFGKVAGKQPGFDYYSEPLQAARFVWTPALLYAWLENPMAATPGTSMMSAGVPDPARRADLIAYLQQVSVRMAADTVSPQ